MHEHVHSCVYAGEVGCIDKNPCVYVCLCVGSAAWMAPLMYNVFVHLCVCTIAWTGAPHVNVWAS